MDKDSEVKGRFLYHSMDGRGFVYAYTCEQCGREYRDTAPESMPPIVCSTCYHGVYEKIRQRIYYGAKRRKSKESKVAICPKDLKPCIDDLCRGTMQCFQLDGEPMLIECSGCRHLVAFDGSNTDCCDCEPEYGDCVEREWGSPSS